VHNVRTAGTRDAAALVPLMEQLGYPAGAEAVAARLARLVDTDDAGVLVADGPGGSLAGMAAFAVVRTIERDEPLGRITALVVDAGHRGRGVGSALVAAVESELRSRGCGRMEVTSGARAERAPAHALYERLGFEDRPRRFVKTLR
jgi:GNAT superfamily N-acetyltransferase